MVLLTLENETLTLEEYGVACIYVHAAANVAVFDMKSAGKVRMYGRDKFLNTQARSIRVEKDTSYVSEG